MLGKRLIDLGAMLAIGDGVLAIAAPRRHSLTWKRGPGWWASGIEWFADRPQLTRRLAAGQVAAAVWLALSQYRDRS